MSEVLDADGAVKGFIVRLRVGPRWHKRRIASDAPGPFSSARERALAVRDALVRKHAPPGTKLIAPDERGDPDAVLAREFVGVWRARQRRGCVFYAVVSRRRFGPFATERQAAVKHDLVVRAAANGGAAAKRARARLNFAADEALEEPPLLKK